MKNLALAYHTDLKEIPNLYERATMVASNEDFNTYVSNIASFFTEKMKVISNSFDHSVQQLFGLNKEQDNYNVTSIINLQKELQAIAGTKMIDIEKIQTPILLGMKLNLLETLSVLSVCFDTINKELIPMLKETDSTVSKVMSNKDFRLQTKPLKDKYSSFIINDTLMTKIEDMIDVNGVKDRTNLINVFPNIDSFRVSYDSIMKLSESASVTKINEIKDYSKIISEKVDVLYKHLSDNKDFKISKEVLNYLGYTLEDAAKSITSAITVIYIYNQSVDILRNGIILASKLNSK